MYKQNDLCLPFSHISNLCNHLVFLIRILSGSYALSLPHIRESFSVSFLLLTPFYFLLPWVGLTTFWLPIFSLSFFPSSFHYNSSSLFQCSVRLPRHCSPLTILQVLFPYYFLPLIILHNLLSLAITTIHSCAFMIVNSPILFCSQHFQNKEKKGKKNLPFPPTIIENK